MSSDHWRNTHEKKKTKSFGHSPRASSVVLPSPRWCACSSFWLPGGLGLRQRETQGQRLFFSRTLHSHRSPHARLLGAVRTPHWPSVLRARRRRACNAAGLPVTNTTHPRLFPPPQAHTILLLQPGKSPASRTFSDYPSVAAAAEGAIGLFEESLKAKHRDRVHISYSAQELHAWLDKMVGCVCVWVGQGERAGRGGGILF